MGKNPDKTKGNSGPCHKCGITITCNEVIYKNETKLQWQVDGKAHYNSDGSCRGNDSSTQGKDWPPVRTVETNVLWEKVEEKSDDQELLVAGLRELRALAYEFTKETHPELSEKSPLFGQINNANMTHLLGLMQIKAVRESN